MYVIKYQYIIFSNAISLSNLFTVNANFFTQFPNYLEACHFAGCLFRLVHNGPWLYGVASLRDLSVSNRDEPWGGEMQFVHIHHLAMTYEPLLGLGGF